MADKLDVRLFVRMLGCLISPPKTFKFGNFYLILIVCAVLAANMSEVVKRVFTEISEHHTYVMLYQL